MENLSQIIPAGIFGSMLVILKPLAILIVGWIIAKIVSNFLWTLFSKSKFIPKLFKLLDVKVTSKTVWSVATQVIYVILLLFVLVAFFQSVDLWSISTTINSFITTGLPKLANAVLLAIIAWLLASVAKVSITKVMKKAKVDKKLSEDIKSTSVTDTSANAVYWIIILFFLPQILGALGQQELLKPITNLTDQLFGYIPNIIAAGVIFVIGLFIAKILKKITIAVLSSFKADKAVEKIGLKGLSVSEIAGSLVYAVVIIPVAIQALEKLEIPAISGPATAMLNTIIGTLPNILTAMIIIGVSVLIGKFISNLITEVLWGIGFDKVLGVIGIKNTAAKKTPSQLVGKLAFSYILLLAVIEAANKIGFDRLSGIFNNFLGFATNVIIGVIILGIGIYLANIASHAISTGSKSTLLPKVAKVAIIVFASFMGLEQMWIGEDIINLAFGIILGAAAIGLALAFGLGARDSAGELVKKWLK